MITENKGLWFMEYADSIRAEFEPMGYPIPSRTAWTWVVRLLGVFDSETAMAAPYLKKSFSLSNDKAKRLLGIQFRDNDVKTTFSKMLNDMIDLKIVPNKRDK